MAFHIGTDEAGYGPNLGPLTVSGTLWEVDDPDCDLYERLSSIVSPRKSKNSEPRLTIADSKSVYQATGSIAALETTVLAICHHLHGEIPADWQSLTLLMCNGSEQNKSGEQKKNGEPDVASATRKLNLPVSADPARIEELCQRFGEECEIAGVFLRNARCRTVFPKAFNQGIAVYGNKASLLSATTLSIVSDLVYAASRNDGPNKFSITCDKHGGRSRYAALLQEYVTEEFVMVDIESLMESRYRWSVDESCFKAKFIAKGESALSVALSSMISKYVREVFMILWNDFWQLKIPGIKPTKGYPVDAKRFKKEIAAAQKSLGISDHEIWRSR